jgi:hypothetical protein
MYAMQDYGLFKAQVYVRTAMLEPGLRQHLARVSSAMQAYGHQLLQHRQVAFV